MYLALSRTGTETDLPLFFIFYELLVSEPILLLKKGLVLDLSNELPLICFTVVDIFGVLENLGRLESLDDL